MRARLVVGEQVLDQLLQRQRVLAHDAHDLPLLGRQLAADAVAQQLGALAHRGERRLELVRDVAQEALLLLLELVQARAQPFEPLAEVAQVLRPVDLDRVREVGACPSAGSPGRAGGSGARSARRTGSRAPARCRRSRARGSSHFSRPCAAVSCSRSIARSVSCVASRRASPARRRRASRSRRRARVATAGVRCGDAQQLVQPALAVAQLARAPRAARGSSGSSASCRAVCAELLRARGRSRRAARVLEDQVLAHDALERRRLLEQLPARAPGLRRLQHRLLALRRSRSSDRISSASA